MPTETVETALPDANAPVHEEMFAGDPSVIFDVRSVNVDGCELRPLGNLGIPDLVDDLFLQGER